MISSKDNPRFGIFYWLDPMEDVIGWKELKDSSISLAPAFSTGWIIEEHETYWVVAADLIVLKGEITDTGRSQSIYKSSYTKFKEIKFNIYDPQMETTKTCQCGKKLK